ncbi:hypothetical protein GON22_18420, partial [Paenibacillus sp. MMS18-CY102]|nr:hypothetical protein [Paenibacillus sp. MMS18-CY102]
MRVQRAGQVQREKFVAMGILAAAAVGTAVSLIASGMYARNDAAIASMLLVCAAGLVSVFIKENKASNIVQLVYWCLFGLAVLSLAALRLGSTLSQSATAAECVRWLGIAALACLLLHSARTKRRLAPSVVLVVACGLIGLATVMGWSGGLPVPAGFVFHTPDVRLSAIGTRLAGFVQYPNTQGAWAAALLLWLLAVLTSRSGSQLRSRLCACLAGPLMLALLLTESRGAALACAASFAFGALLLRGRQLALWLASAGWLSAIAALAYRLAAAPERFAASGGAHAA